MFKIQGIKWYNILYTLSDLKNRLGNILIRGTALTSWFSIENIFQFTLEKLNILEYAQVHSSYSKIRITIFFSFFALREISQNSILSDFLFYVQ